jgi:NADPH:quinone reductase-like Zn-dependent oxidoreductase
MKAAVRRQYGSPDVVELEEIEEPSPGEGEVLIQVHAVSLNASDWEFLTARPAYVRMWGLFKPKYRVLGSDIAGRVEAVGKGVERFRPGDEVFGDILGCFGGLAEYACAPEESLMLKPASMSFEQAAAMPQAGIVALQGLCDKGQIQSGQRVLINGAGGGAGTFAVQLAKSLGAEVTGVDRARKLELMRSIGADDVIDYTQEDFRKSGQEYDLILDLVARRSVFDNKRALGPKGRYVLAGGSLPRILEVLFLGPLLSMGGRKMGILGARANKGLAHMVELFEAGTVVPVIDKTYALSEAAEALRYLGAGQALGKVVIAVREEGRSRQR